MKPDKNSPWLPVKYELADVTAIQALNRGEANADQQKRAMKWIIELASRLYEFNYYPSERDTSFALGRVFVGQQIVKMLKLNVSNLRRNENEPIP